jgi:hypothetical protein
MKNTIDIYPKIIFWTSMSIALAVAFLIFKDLADISQWIIQGSRETTMAVWYNRVPLAVTSMVFAIIASIVWFKTRVGIGTKGFVALLLIFIGMWASGIVNPHIMMRPRQDNAVWVDTAEARKYVEADESVIVYEIDGAARAHADQQVLRPHVAGGAPVNGKNVVMTYCGLTNLGMAYVPEIDGRKLDLAPMTQLENNLVMFDANSGEPIQQLWGQTEADVVAGNDRGMEEYPTFRMPFQKFAKAYPDGEVFINDYLVKDMRPEFWQNPLLFAYDRVMEVIFNTAIDLQRDIEAPVFPTIEHRDERLPTKELIWGFDINHDYVAYTEDFVRENGNLINAMVGGENVVIAWDEEYQSLGVYFNFTGEKVQGMDFFGLTDSGAKLPRIETLKAGAYWLVWTNFFPQTDLNRI